MPKTNGQRGALSSELAGALSHLAAKAPLFTVEEFAKVTGRPKSKTWRVLHSLLEGGWVERLSKGRYSIVPLEAGPEATWSEDSLVVACHLAEPASVAYWSACHYWNWTEQVPRTVFVQTTQRKLHSTRVVLGVRYRFVCIRSNKLFGLSKRTTDRGTFTITDREKTLVDALDHPELCGGIQLVLEMLPAAEFIDWDKVDDYLQRMGSGAIYKRLGFLVEWLGSRLDLPDREVRMGRWLSHLTAGYAPLESGGSSGGPTDTRWRVRINVPDLIRERRRP